MVMHYPLIEICVNRIAEILEEEFASEGLSVDETSIDEIMATIKKKLINKKERGQD